MRTIKRAWQKRWGCRVTKTFRSHHRVTVHRKSPWNQTPIMKLMMSKTVNPVKVWQRSNLRPLLLLKQPNKIKISPVILNPSPKERRLHQLSQMTLSMQLSPIELSRMTIIRSSLTAVMRIRTRHSQLNRRKSILEACMHTLAPNYTINVCSLTAVLVTKRHS